MFQRINYRLPVAGVPVRLLVYCSEAIGNRQVRIDAQASLVKTGEECYIGHWPTYEVTGRPSKYLKAVPPDQVQELASLMLPDKGDVDLSLDIVAERGLPGAKWSVLLVQKTEKGYVGLVRRF